MGVYIHPLEHSRSILSLCYWKFFDAFRISQSRAWTCSAVIHTFKIVSFLVSYEEYLFCIFRVTMWGALKFDSHFLFYLNSAYFPD